MKKQKNLKVNAFVGTPAIENSFSAPLGWEDKLVVPYGRKNLNIHGWDGSSWSLLGSLNGSSSSFSLDNSYESYFLESLTGKQETVSISFFSSESYQNSRPMLVTKSRLHDIEEVPVYNQDDSGKLLTIMSDGSLRWLGLSESYVAEVIVSEGIPSVFSGLEALETNTLDGDAVVTAEEGLYIPATGGSTITTSNYHNGATEQTISVWIKPESLGTIQNPVESRNSGTDNDWGANGSVVMLSRHYIVTRRSNGFVMSVASNQLEFMGPADSNTYLLKNYTFENGTWYKLNLVWTATALKAYVNGVLVKQVATSGSIQEGQHNLIIGANEDDVMDFNGNIKGVTIENVARTDSEILASYESEKP